MSGCWPGSWRGMSIRRIEEDEDGGILARCLVGKSGAVTIYEYGDKGFQGLQKLHPGAVVRTPAKKTKGKDFTKMQREDAKRIGRVRIVIEHTNARFKMFGCMRNKFHGSSEKLHKTVNVLSGFINYHLAMGMASPENTHRKRKKPGPKTYRNNCANARRPETAACARETTMHSMHHGCHTIPAKLRPCGKQRRQNCVLTPNSGIDRNNFAPRPPSVVKRLTNYEYPLLECVRIECRLGRIPCL